MKVIDVALLVYICRDITAFYHKTTKVILNYCVIEIAENGEGCCVNQALQNMRLLVK